MLREKQRLILNNEMELGENVSDEAKGKGRLFTSRFIEGGIAHYEEFGDVLITKETLNNFIHTMVGCPVIIKHKDIDDNNADKERVGVVSKVWYNDYDGWFYCEGIIWDKQAIDLVKNQGWNVSCTYDFETDGVAKTHNGKKIDMEFTNGEFLHLALVPNPRYERANIVMNSKKDDEENLEVENTSANNGFITIDAGTEEERVIWIPENIHYVKPSERSRVLKICDAYKEGAETIYNFEHTRVKPTKEQVQYLKDTVKEINDVYKYKGIAQIEISSSLNNGSWGVCFSPDNASVISIAPTMYKENAQERYDKSVESGFHPKGTGEAIKSVLVHEIGHAITCNSKDEEFWNKIDNLRSEYLKKITEDDVKNPDFISNYARKNKYEFVAEAFCQGHLSKEYGKYTKEVMSLMKQHFLKGNKKKISNSEDNQDMWIEGYGFGYPIDEEEYNKFMKDIDKQKETSNKKGKSSNNIGEITMTVLNDLTKFIKNVVNGKENDMTVENKDKRKIIDEIGGMLKDKVDEEVWRTIVGKLEKLSYEPSEDKKADNKSKNAEDEEEEEKFEEEKEIAENKCKSKNEEDKEEKKVEDKKEEDKKEVKNSMDDVKKLVMGGSTEPQKTYLSKEDRFALGEQY